MEIKIALEGSSAQEASADLVRMDGIQATSEGPSEANVKEIVTLATIVTILSVAKGVVELAKAIKELFEKKRTADPTFRGVILLPDGTRLALENATTKDLERALAALPKGEA